MSAGNKIQLVNEQFLDKGIKTDFEWLSGCVQFFIEEEPTIGIELLLRQVEEQWQLSDLSDSGAACLPNSIFAEKNVHTISGRYPVQLQYVIDISESAYDQLQKLNNKQLDEGKEQPEFKQTYQKTKKKRMLKMEFTDGHQTVTALEYSPIPILNTKLAPGTKMLLNGPMRCVNHILFLEAKNISILGGEVEAIQVTNAFENVLLRELNLPPNPNPRTDYAEATVAAEVNLPNRQRLPAVPMSAANSQHTNLRAAVDAVHLDSFQDDDLLCDIDVDEIAASVRNASQEATQRKQTIAPQQQQQQQNAAFFDDDLDDIDFLHIDANHVTAQTSQSNSLASNQSHNSAAENAPNTHAQSSTKKLSQQATSPSTTLLSICDENYRFKIRGINLVTIKQLNESDPAELEQRKQFIVKAKILEITDRAKVSRQGKWMMGGSIADGLSNDELHVRFKGEVVDKLAGMTGREMQQKYLIRREKPDVRDEIENILKHLGDRLEALNDFLKIEYTPLAPYVVEVIKSAPFLEQKLLEKLNYET